MTDSRFRRNVVDNERGIAALTVVLLGVVLVGIIALSFLAGTETKQYGSALTSPGNNAFMTAEAGLRYTEKCLLNNDPACPAVTANTDWTNLTSGYTKTFGSGNGQFTISFAPIDANTVVVTSVGTYRDSSREVSKTVVQTGGGVCKLTVNAVTSCRNPNIHPQATVTGSVENNYCPSPPLIDPVTFPGNPAGCPNGDYPNMFIWFFGAGGLGPPYQYCNWTHLWTNVSLNGPLTLWIAQDFAMLWNGLLTINGDVTINVGGNFTMEDNASIVVNGTLTIQTAGTFTMRDNAVINTTGGDPADTLLLAESDVDIDRQATFVGGIISNGEVRVRRDARVTGGIIGDRVRVDRNGTVTHDATAGANTTGYGECTP